MWFCAPTSYGAHLTSTHAHNRALLAVDSDVAASWDHALPARAEGCVVWASIQRARRQVLLVDGITDGAAKWPSKPHLCACQQDDSRCCGSWDGGSWGSAWRAGLLLSMCMCTCTSRRSTHPGLTRSAASAAVSLDKARTEKRPASTSGTCTWLTKQQLPTHSRCVHISSVLY